MAANLAEIVISGRTFPNVLALPKSTRIGDLEVQASIENVHTDTLEITEHPIEAGASITDHSFRRPAELILRCGWSNASLKALLGIITGLFRGGTMSKGDYISGIYSQLLKMQQSREPLSVTTSKRHYDNLLIRSLNVTEDQKTSQVLMVEATFREVIIVSTQTATLPEQANQANPAGTAEVINGGSRQIIGGSPAPGGSVPSNDWGFQ